MQSIEIKVGDKLSIFGVSEAMAMTTKREIKVSNVMPEGDGISLFFTVRGKMTILGLRWRQLRESLMFQEWDLPLETDVEACSTVGGVMRGNACINLVGKPEAIREFVEKNNINPYARKGVVIAIEGKEETLVYPEIDERHAVIEGMKEAA